MSLVGFWHDLVKPVKDFRKNGIQVYSHYKNLCDKPERLRSPLKTARKKQKERKAGKSGKLVSWAKVSKNNFRRRGSSR